MRKGLVAGLAVVLLCSQVSLRAQQADPREAVRQLLLRSRLLDDIYVRVPVSVYEQYLRETAGPKDEEPIPPPVAMIAEDGVYTLTGEKTGNPSLHVMLRLRVFAPDKCGGLPVLSDACVWEKAAVKGLATELLVERGYYRFTPPRPGTYEITAQTQFKAEAKSGKISLAIPQTVRTLIRARSPLAWEVTVAGLPPARGTPEAGTDVALALTPRRKLELSYGPPVVERERPASYHMSGDIAWNIDAGGMQVSARLDVAILGGRSDRIDLSLPAAARRVSITGPDVREAQLSPGSAAVFLRGRIAERTRLAVQYDLPAPSAEAARFVPPSIGRGRWAGGTLVVTNTRGSSEILADASSGLRPLALAEIPASARAILAGTPALAYAITSPTFSAQVEILDLGEFALRESIIDSAHFQIAYRRDGAVICKAEYEVRNRSKQFLRVALPAGAQVLVARVNDKARPITPLGGGENSYLLPLVRSMASVRGLVSFPVEIVFICRVDAAGGLEGSAEIPIPRVDLPIAYAWCEAYLPAGMEAVRISGPLRRVEQYSSETATGSLAYGAAQLAEGYERGRRFKAGADLERKPDEKPDREVGVPVLSKVPVLNRLFTNRGRTVESLETDKRALYLLKPAIKPAAETQPAIGAPPDGVAYTADGRQVDLANVATFNALIRNYYRSGQDYYEKGNLAEAEAALKKALELAPRSAEGENARRLLGNIALARGELKLKSRTEKVAGAKVAKELEAANVELAQRQKQTVEKYRDAMREGKKEEATVQYQAAEALGRQLVARGAGKGEQEVVMRELRELQKGQEETLQAEVSRSLQEMKRLAEAGEYEKALQAGKRAQDIGSNIRYMYVVRGAQPPADRAPAKAQKPTTAPSDDLIILMSDGHVDIPVLQKKMEDLAVKAARKQAEEVRDQYELEQRKLHAARPVEQPAVEAPPAAFGRYEPARPAGRPGGVGAGGRGIVRDGLETIVRVPEGGTVLIGGQRRSEREDKRARLEEGLRERRRAVSELEKRIDESKAEPAPAEPRRSRAATVIDSRQGYSSGYDAVPQAEQAKLDVESAVAEDRKQVILTLRPQLSPEEMPVEALEEALQDADVRVGELNQRIDELRDDLMKQRAAAPAAQPLASTGEGGEIPLLHGKLAELEKQRSEAIRAWEALKDMEPGEIAQLPDVQIPVQSDPILARLRDERMGLDAERQDAEGRLGQKHPGVQNLRARIVNLDKQIQDRTRELTSAQVAVIQKEPQKALVDAQLRAVKLQRRVDDLEAERRRKVMEHRREPAPERVGIPLVGDIPVISRLGRDEQAAEPPAAPQVPGTFLDVSEADFRLASEARQRKVEALTKQVRDLRGQQRYEEALEAASHLLNLDPGNAWAAEQVGILRQFVVLRLREEDEWVGEAKTAAGQAPDAEREMRAWHEVLQYPRRWEEARKGPEDRDAAPAEPEQDRAVRQKLKTVIPELDFDEIPLRDAIEYLRDVSGANIEVKWRALELQGIDKDKAVTVHLGKVPAETALRVVLNDVGGTEPLEYVIESGVVTISTKEDMSRRTSTRVYDVQHLLSKVPRFERPQTDLANRQGNLPTGGMWGELANNQAGADVPPSDEVVDGLVEIIKSTVEPEGLTGGESPIRHEDGKLIVTQTARGHEELTGLLRQLRDVQRADKAGGKEAYLGTRVYDIRGLLATGDAFTGAQRRPATAPAPRETAERIVGLIKANVDPKSWRMDGAEIRDVNGKLIVTQTGPNQDAVADLLTRLEAARGPQVVQHATQLAEQRAKGVVELPSPEDGGWGYRLRPEAAEEIDPALKKFIDRNYEWALQRRGSYGALTHSGVASLLVAGGHATEEELARKLRYNLGQKIQVSSMNFNASSGDARGLGINFTTGNNYVTYAVIDEAQLRTLMQLDAANRRALAGEDVVAANEQGQETIVGTDALLANDMFVNAAYAGEDANKLDIKSNPIDLEHEKYILIDNGLFLTAVKAGAMRHWTEAPELVTFAEVPETIEVPRVGRLVKFEKSLVDPSDNLVIRLDYRWKGD